MNRRILGILLITILFVMIGTGVLMYLKPFNKNITSLHTFFALLFIIGMLFHLINNKLPLTNYLIGKRLSKFKKLQSPLLFFVLFLLGLGVYINTPWLNGFYNWGNEYRNLQLGTVAKTFDYQIINLEKKLGKQRLSIELKKGKAFKHPLFAIWLEDDLGNYIETLYISKVIASSKFRFGKKVGKKWQAATLRRPEALPYWSHKRNIQAKDGLYIPLENAPDLDAVSGATATNNFVVNSKTNLENAKTYKVLMEINQSFDWNNFYTKTKFPNDAIYSGSGKVGQPSLIYATSISTKDLNQKTYKFLNLIGHGHHSGKDGNLYTNLTTITTAKEIADRIILEIN